MKESGKWSYSQIIKDKKLTLLTTLLNINCLIYYISSKILFASKTTTMAFSSQHFIAMAILAVIDLLVCWGYIHFCIKKNYFDEENLTEEVQSSL